jgi:hypothetical protein
VLVQVEIQVVNMGCAHRALWPTATAALRTE